MKNKSLKDFNTFFRTEFIKVRAKNKDEKLKEIFQYLGIKRKAPDIECTSLEVDSRQVKKEACL